MHAVTADGYFKIAIRKDPHDLVWSFAVEWNESCRIVGFFGPGDKLLEIRDQVPSLPMETIPGKGTDFMRYRQEEPLPDDDDMLFHFPGDEA